VGGNWTEKNPGCCYFFVFGTEGKQCYKIQSPHPQTPHSLLSTQTEQACNRLTNAEIHALGRLESRADRLTPFLFFFRRRTRSSPLMKNYPAGADRHDGDGETGRRS